MGSPNLSLPDLSTIFDKIHLLCCNTKTIKSPLFLGSIITGNFHLLPYWECTWCICRKLKSYTEPPLLSHLLYQQKTFYSQPQHPLVRVFLSYDKYQVTSLLTQIPLSLADPTVPVPGIDRALQCLPTLCLTVSKIPSHTTLFTGKRIFPHLISFKEIINWMLEHHFIQRKFPLFFLSVERKNLLSLQFASQLTSLRMN